MRTDRRSRWPFRRSALPIPALSRRFSGSESMPQNAVWRGGPSLRVVGGRFLEELLQIILPVAILILAFVKHLEAKGLILEVFAELLPRNLSTDLSEV